MNPRPLTKRPSLNDRLGWESERTRHRVTLANLRQDYSQTAGFPPSAVPVMNWYVARIERLTRLIEGR